MTEATTTTFALPTEPLLELPTKPLRKQAVEGEHHKWLLGLLHQSNPYERGEHLFRVLRKHLLEEEVAVRLQALCASAASGKTEGVAALAALVAVRAPGDDVINAVREFRSLHRLGERFNARLDRGERLDEGERALVDAACEMDELSRAAGYDARMDPMALPHPRDIGVAGGCRKLFAQLVKELREKGNLDRETIQLFAKVANIELQAMELRASALAGSINPYSARHVSSVMPILGTFDADVENMRAFTSQLREDPKISHFHEQNPAFVEQMDTRERQLLLERVSTRPALWPLRRVLAAVQRNPLTLRELSFYLTHLYALSDALVASHARKHPIDPFEGCLMALEFARDHTLRLPAGERVTDAVRESLAAGQLDKFGVDGGKVTLSYDGDSAHRSSSGVGLPLPVLPYDGIGDIPPDQSVKDLVMENLNNTSILAGLLKNPKVVATPGIVELIVTRVRAMVILETVCQNRHLHTGFANKGVPLALLRSPMRIPLKTLRRFVNVRYVNKMELRRLSVDVSSVRREIVDEVVMYLKTLN